MRIVHTESSLGWGGQEIRIINESLALSARGHSIKIISSPMSNIYREARKEGIPSIALRIEKKGLRGVFALLMWISRNDFDVINCHSSTDSWLLAVVSKIKKITIVRTRHISSPIPNNRPTRWLYSRPCKIVTTGTSIKKQLISEAGVNGKVITSVPTGVDTKKFFPANREQKQLIKSSLGLPQDKKFIIILATLRSWKGHLFLIDAFKKSALTDEWNLLIVGDGPYRSTIQEHVRRAQLECCVTFTGQQSNPEDWLRASDIFCLPSYANEGVPQALIQAMLTKLPIITTDVGSITDAVKHNHSALICAPKDHHCIAKNLKKLTESTELANSYAVKAHEEALLNLTEEKMADSMELIFTQCIKNP